MCAPPLNVYFLGYTVDLGILSKYWQASVLHMDQQQKQLYRHYNKYIERDTQKKCVYTYTSLWKLPTFKVAEKNILPRTSSLWTYKTRFYAINCET